MRLVRIKNHNICPDELAANYFKSEMSRHKQKYENRR